MGQAYPPQWHVAADLVILARKGASDMVALIRRKNDPGAGKLALPGGFVEVTETLHDAAARELQEETGMPVDSGSLVQLGAYWYPGRDPRGPVLSVAFLAVVDELTELRAGDDAARADWYDVQEVLTRRDELAFDHERILRDGLARQYE